MIPLAVPNIVGNERRYLNDCVDTNMVSSVGPFVNKFEDMLGHSEQFTHVFAASSGTAALHVALVALGIEKNDLVIVPTLTFIATANSIAYCGAEPWILDIDEATWTLDPIKLAESLHRETFRDASGVTRHKNTNQRVFAVLPVYTLGIPADMDFIVDIAGEFGLKVLADAACAIGARYKRRPLSETGAHLTVFSFNGNKTITCGGGGAVCGGDEFLGGLVRHLATTARLGQAYDHDRVGYNYKMTNLQAAVGCGQIEMLSQFLKKKREINAFYNAQFELLNEASSFPEPSYALSSCWLSGFFLKSGNVDALLSRIREKGIETRSFWKPIHLQAPFSNCLCGRINVSEATWKRIITLPSSTGISDVQLEQVASIVKGLIR